MMAAAWGIQRTLPGSAPSISQGVLVIDGQRVEVRTEGGQLTVALAARVTDRRATPRASRTTLEVATSAPTARHGRGRPNPSASRDRRRGQAVSLARPELAGASPRPDRARHRAPPDSPRSRRGSGHCRL